MIVLLRKILKRVIASEIMGGILGVVVWGVIIFGISIGISKLNKHSAIVAPTTNSPQKSYSTPVSGYNGDNLFTVDYPCTPERRENNYDPQPSPDNISKDDYHKEISYRCTTSNGFFWITTDYFPSSYSQQQMVDILHEYAGIQADYNDQTDQNDKVNDQNTTAISRKHTTFLGHEAFLIDFEHKKNLLPDGVEYADTIYFQKDNLIYSLEDSTTNDLALHDFVKSFRLEQ